MDADFVVAVAFIRVEIEDPKDAISTFEYNHFVILVFSAYVRLQSRNALLVKQDANNFHWLPK